jgi:hypothetical protein
MIVYLSFNQRRIDMEILHTKATKVLDSIMNIGRVMGQLRVAPASMRRNQRVGLFRPSNSAFALFIVSTKLLAHGGQYAIGKIGLAARAEAFKQRGTEHGGGTASSMAVAMVLRPSPESGTRPA